MWWALRGWAWRGKARRLLVGKGWTHGSAAAEAHLRWNFAREALDEWGGPLMDPELVLDMDLAAYREPEAALAGRLSGWDQFDDRMSG